MSSRTLGLVFLAPALLFALLFFFVPVILTGVFAFTNMSTATGILGGAWQVSPPAVRALTEEHGEAELAEALAIRRYVVDDAGLAALAAEGRDASMIEEIRVELGGQSWSDRRTFENVLKDLDNRPRSTRDRKAVAAHFERSVIGQRFESGDDLIAAVEAGGVTLTEPQRVSLMEATWTGWHWTSENFVRMVSVPDVRRTMINTLIYVFVTLALFNTGFALVLAVTTHYLPERQAGFFRSVWLLPRVLPPVLYVLMWKWLAWDGGFLNALLGPLGVDERNWMMDTAANAWVFVVLINGFIGASMGMIIFGAAIKAIPQQLFYASEVDGASRWQQIRFVILPQLRWPILFITAYQTLSLLASFQEILLATGGGPGGATETWAVRAYLTALSNYAGNLAYGYGAAMALVLVVVGITASIAYLFFFDFRREIRPTRIEH